MSQRESTQSKRERLAEIIALLKGAYPDAKVGLEFESPFQLLVATILSAQCTDVRVNLVTPALFAALPGPKDFLNAPLEQIEELIHSTGFYRNKARNIQACCKVLLERFDGEVPVTMEELVSLPGVGRKTANCVLSNCFGIPGITVDTHVLRISNLLLLSTETDPVKLEFALMKLMPADLWNDFDLYIISHGRSVCKARNPACSICAVSPLCPSAVIP